MIQDLHSHTYYSFCGKDEPDDIVRAAIDGGIELFGICDHNYSVGYRDPLVFKTEMPQDSYQKSVDDYREHMTRIKNKYADKINILVGIEIATIDRANYRLPDNVDVSAFDYCLVEGLSNPDSFMGGNILAYAEHLKVKNVGIAHTDLFAHIKCLGEDTLRYFERLAERNIFWELNVNYDSIHGYREHAYVAQLLNSKEQQDIVRKSGVKLSVGFDGHRVEDYLPERVKACCQKLEELGLEMIFNE